MEIRIEWLDDEHDCEMCGWSVASGAKVSFKGGAFSMIPRAHCFDSTDFDREAVLRRILAELGYSLVEVNA